jgi:hypothetical protein
VHTIYRQTLTPRRAKNPHNDKRLKSEVPAGRNWKGTTMQELAEAIQEAKDGITGSHYGLAYILRGFQIKPASDQTVARSSNRLNSY